MSCAEHILECKTLEENRKTQMVKLGEALEEARGGGTRTIETGFGKIREIRTVALKAKERI
jgi:hypothetical protein